MRIIVFLMYVLLNEVMTGGSVDNEHVHIKIHVPEIIKHHVHTKTVFIHMHKSPSKKKHVPRKKVSKQVPKVHHEEEYREDWNSWSSHDYHENHVDKYNDEYERSQAQKNSKHSKKRDRINKHFPTSQHLNYQESKEEEKNEHAATGYTSRPQYENYHKNIESNDVEPVTYTYEEGYKKGLHSETGHLHTDEITKFHDDKYEEHDLFDEKYTNDSKERTHAGRYFVDEAEYKDNPRYKKSNEYSQKNVAT